MTSERSVYKRCSGLKVFLSQYRASSITQRIKSLTVWWFPRGGDDGDEMLELNIKPALSPSPPLKLKNSLY